MRMIGSMIVGFSTGFFSGFWVFCSETSPLKKKIRKQIKNNNFENDWYSIAKPVKNTTDDDRHWDSIDIH